MADSIETLSLVFEPRRVFLFRTGITVTLVTQKTFLLVSGFDLDSNTSVDSGTLADDSSTVATVVELNGNGTMHLSCGYIL